MLFPTIGFTVFFFVVLAFWPLMRTTAARTLFLAVASGTFCAVASPALLLYVAAWAGLLTFAGKRREHGARVAVLSLALLQLVFWKAFETLPRGMLPEAVAHWVIPLGVSFFTFQGLTYLFARMKGTIDTPWDFTRVFAFCSFFPTIFSGPILRAKTWSEHLEQPVPLYTKSVVSRALGWVVLGLAYKLVLATLLGEIVDAAWSDPGEQPAAALWLAAYAYAFQLYADFAGYSLLAQAVALLLGFAIPANFDQPYLATSVQAFWRRWHMSFSTWLRDHLYIDLLGGNKHGRSRQIINVLVTFFLCGAWHGLALHYLIWGAWQAVAVAYSTVSRMVLGERAPPGRAKLVLHWLVAFHAAVFGWVWFRAPSAEAAVDYFSAMATTDWSWRPEYLTGIVLVLVALAVHVVEKRVLNGMTCFADKAGAINRAVFWALAIVFVLMLSPAGLPPFIYFRY